MRSMTGYGTARGMVDDGRFSIDVRSLNHRYKELIVRMPPMLASLEPLVRDKVSDWFERGRIEISVMEEVVPTSVRKFRVDHAMAREHSKCLVKLAKIWRMKPEAVLCSVNPLSYIVTELDDAAPKNWWKHIGRLVDNACKQADVMRRREGKAIEKDQKKRLSNVAKLTHMLEKRTGVVLGHRRASMRKRLESVGANGTQLANEEYSLINRQDVAEEITRLKSHVSQYLKLMDQDVVGRKLDFLLQEMLREVTTLSSKASDNKVSQLTVECKAEIERLREQVQNIE